MPATEPKPKTPLGRKLLLVAGVFLLGASVLEVAARVRLHLKYGRTDNDLYETVREPSSGLIVPKPNQDVGFVHINAQGFRGEDVTDPKPAGTVRIAFLGASTTFCAEVEGDENTWPARVTVGLNDSRLGVRFDGINAGVPAFKAVDSKLNLIHRVARFDPDVVVIYHATNDLSRDTRDLAEANGIFTGEGGKASFLAEISVAWNLIEKNLRVMARQQASSAGAGRLDFDADQLADEFRAELRDLVAEARSRASVVALVTFSTRLRADQSPEEKLKSCNTSLYYMPYMDVDRLLDGFAAYNRAIVDVARETGAVLIGEENSIPGDDEHFRDSVHFTDQGCAKQAERVLRALRADPTFQTFVASRARG